MQKWTIVKGNDIKSKAKNASVVFEEPTRMWANIFEEPTRMWANAQRDSRPAKYRWRPLFNAAKFGSCPLLECHAVTLPRRETC